MNLLKETLEAIAQSGHAPEDIIFIGSTESGHSCSWEEFSQLADIEYDSSFGAQEVASDLIVVFADGHQLRRAEYDGSEWWDFIAPFKAPETAKNINRLVGDLWPSLSELNP